MSQITESEQWKGLTASQRSAMANAKAGVDEQAPIHMAADIVSIDQLRAAGADVNAKDKKGKYPIQTVKEECQASLLAAHAGKSGAKKTKDFTGDHNANVSLLKAATNGDKADIEAALKDGASPRHISKDKKTPLHLVLESGNCTKKQKEEIVKKLIAAGADVNAKDPSGRTPLFMAAEAGMTEIVSELVKTPGIKVKEKASHKAKVETLAQDGVTTTTRLTGGVGNVGGSIAGRTAYKAVKAELKAAESYLAKEEKRIKAEGVKLKEGTAQGVQEKYDRIDNKKKIAAKRVAALKATQKVLEVPNREARLAYLAKKGKPKDIKTKLDTKDTAEARLNLEAALFAAVEHGNPDSLKVLLDHCKPPRGNDPPLGEMRNDKGQNLFDVAFENAKTAKVFTAKHRQCMMEIASAKQARGETEPLVSREKIAESLKPKGWFKSRSSLAKSLIEACGEALPSGLSTKDPSTGNLLLHDAILKGDKKATEMVIAQATKTHLEHMNEDGKTVLHVAAERGKKDFVKQLLAKVEKTTGMDAKKYVETPTKDEHKQNAIHLAAQAHKTNSKGERVEKDSKHELMRFLVKESRADVSLKDAHGKMPIDYALDDKHPHPKAAKKLLHYGSPNPNKGGITRIEEEMFKTRRGSIKELSKAKTSIAETKKLFEKIYPKEQYEHKYAEGKPKLLCMVVENGSDRAEDLIAKLTQPPYLNVNSPEKENFQDIKDAAQLAAKDGKQSLIDKMRNGISDQISMGQGTEAKNALLVAFDKAVVTGEVEKDRAERIAKLQAASTGVSSTAAARQAPRPSAARVLKPAGAAGANPEDATTAATIASTLAAARSSARGSSRSTNARRAVNPAQTLHLTDDGELDASVKEKFKDFLIHGIDNVDKRTNLQNTAIEKESASLIGNLLASGKVQNCEIAKETTSGAKGKIFEVTLADYRNKTLFFPKFDQDTGNQIMKDGKPVIEMLIIGDEGEIIGGTITNPSKNSSMP